MKVALYYPWVYLTSGAERTIVELTGRSRHAWTIFTNRYEPDNTFPELKDRRIVQLPEVSVRRSIGAVGRAGWRLFMQRLPMQEFDALVVVCEGLGDMVTFRNHDRPTLCFCLTPLRIAFDPFYRKTYFAKSGALKRIAVAAGSVLFRWIDRRAWKHYDHVMCISEEVKRRVLRGRLAPAERIEVAYVGLGFDPPDPSGRFEKYFLLPGRIMWTKNIELGIAAFRRFAESNSAFADFRLVVAGIVDEKSKPYLAKLRSLAGDDPRIEFRVHPSDAELADLYDRCYGVLFTAFNEDWGIVPLEGMAFGKPAIVTNRGGPCESVDHGVQGFREEPTPEVFAARMAELARDPDKARRMGEIGKGHIKKFSWDVLVDRVDEQLEAIAANRTQTSHLAATATNR